MGQLFGTDGIRGRANQHPVTAEIALGLGRALAEQLRTAGDAGPVIIGRGPRSSGRWIEAALTAGLLSQGRDVDLVGVIPTPGVAFITAARDAAAGLMVTASHNPAPDNGVKVFGGDGFKLADDREEALEQAILAGHSGSSQSPGKVFEKSQPALPYIEHLAARIKGLDLTGMCIVVDGSHGAAHVLGPQLIRSAGAEVVTLGTDPDGSNINDGCGATDPEALKQMVIEQEAQIGFAFDGDADRLVVCGPGGEIVHGDRLMGMLAKGMKERSQLKGDLLVVTVMSNLGLIHAMKEIGIRTLTTAVGDRYVMEEMRRQGGSFGGEQSGHLIFMDHATTGDGILSALEVLLLIGQHGNDLDLGTFVDLYPQKLTNLRVREKVPIAELAEVQEVLLRCTEVLGEGGRHLVRYSGTENKVRVLVEARNEESVEKWTREIVSSLENALT